MARNCTSDVEEKFLEVSNGGFRLDLRGRGDDLGDCLKDGCTGSHDVVASDGGIPVSSLL